MRCHYSECTAPAVGRFAFDQGSKDFPDDYEQALCVEHGYKAIPLGGIDLIEAITDG